jgi:hypothetical protein
MQYKMMSNEKRMNLKGGILKGKQAKLRIMLTKTINEFISPGGTDEKYMEDMPTPDACQAFGFQIWCKDVL